MKTARYIIVILVVVMAVRLLCTPVSAQKAAKIGALAGLTGFMSVDASNCIRGLELKLEQVNWEVAGRKIELIKEDYASNPATAVDKARKLIEHDKVDVVLGPLLTPALLGVADYLTKSRTPHFSFYSTSTDLFKFGGGNEFMWAATQPSHGYFLGLYAYDALDYRTATVVHPDNAAGEEFCGGVIQAFEKKAGKVVQRQRVPQDTMDFAPYITATKKADCCVFWDHAPFVPPFLKQYAGYGLKMPILMPNNGPANEIIMAEAGDASLGMFGSSCYTPLIENDMNKQFVEDYVRKYKIQPAVESVGGYIATTMFLEAVKATGGDTSNDKIIDALHKLEVETPAGIFSFTPDGRGFGNFYIQKVTKIGDRYAWEVIHEYRQIVLDIPK